jgi:chromosome segregation ATPase
MQIELVTQSTGMAGTQTTLPGEAGPSARHSPVADDPLNTVGLALLAYGLVQLLSKFIDKIGIGRTGVDVRGVGFGEEDRKRLERVTELLAAVDQRLQRVSESNATQQRLAGQALDELRECTRRHESLARKLHAVWNRIGSRNDDQR